MIDCLNSKNEEKDSDFGNITVKLGAKILSELL